MNKYLLSFVVLFLAAATALNAQSKEEAKYRKASEELKKQVWAWDMPEFKTREVPPEYAKASKVVLAHHTELTADSKSKFQFYVVTFNVKKEQTITEVVREMIKVNDKNAVSDYSELTFTQFQKSSGFYYNEKSTTYVGVRIIKPDGTIREMDADDIVLTKDVKTVKKARVAIPDLQAGDVLDYFIATEQLMSNDFSTKRYQVILFDDAPVLHHSFHAQLGKKYAIDYRSYNGAPELKVSKNEDRDIVIDVEKKNMPAFETSLWVAPALQLPFIRMNISLGYNGVGSTAMNTKNPGDVSKNPDNKEIMEATARYYSGKYYDGYWMKPAKVQYDELLSETRKKARQSGLNFNDLSDEEKAAYLYYVLRYTKFLTFNIDELSEQINSGFARYNGLTFPLFALFKASGLDPAILVSNYHSGVRYSEILDGGDLTETTYLPGSGHFFNFRTIFDTPFSIPEAVEGASNTKSFTFSHPGMVISLNKTQSLTKISDGINVPISGPEKNAHIENLKLSIGNKNELAVKRSTTLKGYYKTDAQSTLILYEDFYESERKLFNDKKSLIEQLEEGRKSKKYVDEVKNAFAEARKNQKEAFETEAKEWFEQEVTNLTDYKIQNLGVRHTAPDFVYTSSFDLNGLVKKANNNYIIEIGKIQGTPLLIKEEQRKRDMDIYMPFARSIEYHIELQIPEGYTAEGIDALNKSVKNEAGFFTAEASATDNIVTIILKKHYFNKYEPARNWEKLISFTDAASDWANAKLLLKKK